jgi:hypothetical protein
MAASGRAVFPPPATPQRRTTSPNKRQRALDDVFGDNDDDDDVTPRPQYAMLPPPRPMPPPSPVAGSCTSPSKSSSCSSPTKGSGSKSKKSSPVKNLAHFAHTPVTIQGKSFAQPGKGFALPEALADMVDIISRQARGNRVVSCSMRVSEQGLVPVSAPAPGETC